MNNKNKMIHFNPKPTISRYREDHDDDHDAIIMIIMPRQAPRQHAPHALHIRMAIPLAAARYIGISTVLGFIHLYLFKILL
jgi:hypothetical protein